MELRRPARLLLSLHQSPPGSRRFCSELDALHGVEIGQALPLPDVEAKYPAVKRTKHVPFVTMGHDDPPLACRGRPDAEGASHGFGAQSWARSSIRLARPWARSPFLMSGPFGLCANAVPDKLQTGEHSVEYVVARESSTRRFGTSWTQNHAVYGRCWPEATSPETPDQLVVVQIRCSPGG